MDKTTKTILIVLGSLFLVCACAAGVLFATGLWSLGKVADWAQSNTSEDPARVAEIASEIADFEIPAGFEKQYGMKLGSLSLVQYMTRDENTYIFVTQFPAGTSINVDEMMREIKNNSRNPNSPWYNTDTHLVEQKSVMIHGDQTKLSINEGTNDQGVSYRMANAQFQGNGQGPALLMIISPTDQWDARMVEDFIASIQ